MSTTTARIVLVKEDNAENYSVGTVNANSDKIDAAVGFEACTSSTRPSAPFNGKGIWESDTGAVLYSNGSSPASGSWKHLWTPDGPVVVGAVGAAAPLRGQTSSTLAGNRFLDARKVGEAQPGFTLDFDGKHQWGPGGSTAPDVNLYRSAADTLRTDDALYVGGALTVVGAVTGPVALGLRAKGTRTSLSTATTTITGVLRVAPVTILAGRAYRISVSTHPRSSVAADRVLTEVRVTTDGVTTPTTASPVLPGSQNYFTAPASGSSDSVKIDAYFEPAFTCSLWMLLTVSRATGTGSVALYGDGNAPTELSIEDVGLAVGNTGTNI